MISKMLFDQQALLWGGVDMLVYHVYLVVSNNNIYMSI
jgi:hypothetical protein